MSARLSLFFPYMLFRYMLFRFLPFLAVLATAVSAAGLNPAPVVLAQPVVPPVQQDNRGPDSDGQRANNRLFDRNFADFSNLKFNSSLFESTRLFLSFVTELEIRIGSVAGDLENKISIRNLRGSRGGAEFLSIGHIAVEWDISELPAGRLTIKRLLLDQVKIRAGWADRAAGGLEFETGEDRETLPAFKLFGFEMPRLPLSLDVRDLLVRNLQLTKDIAGQDIAVDLGGRLLIPAGQKPIDAHLDVVRRDAVRGAARAKLRWQPETGELAMLLRAGEGHHGLLQNILNLEPTRSHQLLIEGRGPIRDWRSKILFDLSGITRVEGVLGLKSDAAGQTAHISGTAAFLEDAKARFPKMTSLPVALDIQAGHKSKGRFRFKRISLSSQLLDLDGNGWIDPANNDADINLNLVSKDGTALQDFAPGLALERSTAGLRYVRKGNEARIQIDATAALAGWGNFQTEQINTRIEITSRKKQNPNENPEAPVPEIKWTDSFTLKADGNAARLVNTQNGSGLFDKEPVDKEPADKDPVDKNSVDEDLAFSASFDFETDPQSRIRIKASQVDVTGRSAGVSAAVSGTLPTEQQRRRAGGWLNALRPAVRATASLRANGALVRYRPFLESGKLRAGVTLENGVLKTEFDFAALKWGNAKKTVNALLPDPAVSKIRGNLTQSEAGKPFRFNLKAGSGRKITDLSGSLSLTGSSKRTGQKTGAKNGVNLSLRSRAFDLTIPRFLNSAVKRGTAGVILEARIREGRSSVDFKATSTDLEPENPRLKHLFSVTPAGTGKAVTLSGTLDAVKGRPLLIKNAELTAGGFHLKAEASIPKSADIQVQGTGRTADLMALLGHPAVGTVPQSAQTAFRAKGRGQRWDITLNAKPGPLVHQTNPVSRLLGQALKGGIPERGPERSPEKGVEGFSKEDESQNGEGSVSARVEIRRGAARLAKLQLVKAAQHANLEEFALQQTGTNTYRGSVRLKSWGGLFSALTGSSKQGPPTLPASVTGLLGGRLDFTLTNQPGEKTPYSGHFSTVLEIQEKREKPGEKTEQKTGEKIATVLHGTALHSGFLWSRQSGLKLTGLKAEKENSSASVRLELTAQNRFRSARIDLSVLDVSLLNALASPYRLQGQVTGPVKITANGGSGIGLDYRLSAKGIRAEQKKGSEIPEPSARSAGTAALISADALELNGRLTGRASGFMETAKLVAQASGNGLNLRNRNIDRVNLTLAGPFDRLGFSLNASLNTAGLTAAGLKPEKLKPGKLKAAKLKAGGQLGFKKQQTETGRTTFDWGQFDLRFDRLTANSGRLGLRARKPVYVRINKDNRFVSVQDAGIGGVTLSGQIRLQGEQVSGRIDLRDPDLGWLSAFRGIGQAKGAVTAYMELGGTARDPVGKGSFRLTDVHFTRPRGAGVFTGDLPVINGRGTLGLQGQALSVDGLITGPRRMALDAAFSLPVDTDFKNFRFGVRQNAPVAGRFTGNMSAVEVSEYFALDRDNLGGLFEVDARVAGTLNKPDITGGFSWLDARYENEASGLLLEDINIRGVAKGDRLLLKSEPGSNVAIDGQIVLKPKLRFPTLINIQSQRANLIARDDASLLISSFLRLEGALSERLRLVGDVVINEAEVRMPNLRGSGIIKLDVIELNKPASLNTPPDTNRVNQSIQTNIRIRSGDNLNFRGAGVATKWGLDVRATGPVGQPVLSGTLFSNSGGMTLLGKRFKLTRGELSYNAQTVEDPLLNILMERETDTVLVQLSVSGTLQKPAVAVSSVPVLPTDQVISQLLFNNDPTRLNGVQAIELVTALTRLQNFGRSEDFVERLRLLTGLDSLTLAATGSDNTALRAGKNIGEKTGIWAEQGLSTSSSRIGGEYRLLPNVRLEADYGIDQQGKVGLDWTFDY